MTFPAILALTVCSAAVLFFLVRWVQLRAGYNAMTALEQRYAEINEVRRSSDRVPIKDRIRAEMLRVGLADDLFPLFAVAAFVYLACAVALRFTGLPELLTLAVALPMAAGVAWTVVIVRAQRRRAAFNMQLIDLLDLVQGQVQGGVGAERGLMLVAPQMPEPIKAEMSRTLDVGRAGKDLIGAMRELRDRYPSRAFDMFIAALEIDRAEGQAIGPALKQASELLKRDFALANEAKAEIAQTKYEFLAVGGIVVGICAYLVLGGSPETRHSYQSFAGFIALSAAAGNVSLGTFRFFRMMNKIKGDT